MYFLNEVHHSRSNWYIVSDSSFLILCHSFPPSVCETRRRIMVKPWAVGPAIQPCLSVEHGTCNSKEADQQAVIKHAFQHPRPFHSKAETRSLQQSSEFDSSQEAFDLQPSTPFYRLIHLNFTQGDYSALVRSHAELTVIPSYILPPYNHHARPGLTPTECS